MKKLNMVLREMSEKNSNAEFITLTGLNQKKKFTGHRIPEVALGWDFSWIPNLISEIPGFETLLQDGGFSSGIYKIEGYTVYITERAKNDLYKDH